MHGAYNIKYKRLVNWQNGTKWGKTVDLYVFGEKTVKSERSMTVKQGHSTVYEWVEKHKGGWAGVVVMSVATIHLLYHMLTVGEQISSHNRTAKYRIWVNSPKWKDAEVAYGSTEKKEVITCENDTNRTDY